MLQHYCSELVLCWAFVVRCRKWRRRDRLLLQVVMRSVESRCCRGVVVSNRLVAFILLAVCWPGEWKTLIWFISVLVSQECIPSEVSVLERMRPVGDPFSLLCRHHLSYGVFLDDKSKNHQNCSVLCCVRQLYTMICTREQLLKMSVDFRFRFSFCVFSCLQCFDTVGWAAGRASGL